MTDEKFETLVKAIDDDSQSNDIGRLTVHARELRSMLDQLAQQLACAVEIDEAEGILDEAEATDVKLLLVEAADLLGLTVDPQTGGFSN